MLKYCYENFGADKFTGTNARSFAHLESRSFLMEREGEGRGRGGGRGAETIAYFTIIGMCVNQGMVLRVLDHRRGTQFYDFAVIKGCPSEMVTLNRA